MPAQFREPAPAALVLGVCGPQLWQQRRVWGAINPSGVVRPHNGTPQGVDGLQLVDARALPASGSAADRWWPSGVDAYGCLRAGELYAPFFVAWDRSRAPAAHRRQRVSSWRSFVNAESTWGACGVPPTVIVCAGGRQLEQWAGTLERGAGNGAADRPHVILGLAADLAIADAGDEIWWVPGVPRPALLIERLAWGPAPPAGLQPPSLAAIAGPLPAVSRRRAPLRTSATSTATAVARPANVRERLAALTLATDAEEKLLTEWVGQHPLLEAAQLAVLLARPVETIERRIERLVRCEVIETITRWADGDRVTPRRLALTNLGLSWLAARDGVPPRRYAEHGAVAATSGSSGTTSTRLDGLLRHFEHSVGVNRVLVRLASDARLAGHHLREWRSEAASTRRFRDGERSYWIRPDAGGVLQSAQARHEFLLEYDRGTERAANHRSKLVGYHRYFATRQFESDYDGRPVVLVVSTSDEAEHRIARAVREAEREFEARLPLLLTTEWRFARDPYNSLGLLGPLWRTSDSPELRRHWPESEEKQFLASVQSQRRRSDSVHRFSSGSNEATNPNGRYVTSSAGSATSIAVGTPWRRSG
ncbi:MAG: replication-relaxation family protein [Chloroflexi bacterium]|nr:replication-relaxation family protein [Chloroflexota bacterium]MDA1147017.1 replication-relaxation family protein [Chloroflexota bacterium]